MTSAATDVLDLLADVATRGVRVAAPVRRTGGAGPSDDGHLVLLGLPAAVRRDGRSRYEVLDGNLLADGEQTGIRADAVPRPRFYDLTTDDGIPFEQIARLHGRDVLASTVIQTCTRYATEATRCRFCAIETSLRAGVTTAVKSPADLAAATRAAVELDGVRSVVLTTGTTPGSDRGAAHLARCVAAITAAVPRIGVQVQCEPPGDLRWLQRLHDAGARTAGIHVESLDEAVRARWTPGKAEVSVAGYEKAWREAVRVFGRNRVSTYLLVGLGEDPDDLVDGCERLVAIGVYPFVVPYRPLAGTLAAGDGVGAPDPTILADVARRVAALLVAAGMSGAEQGAGCAACGACSLLAAAGA